MVKTHDFSIAKYGETQSWKLFSKVQALFTVLLGKEKNSTCGVEGGDGHSLVIQLKWDQGQVCVSHRRVKTRMHVENKDIQDEEERDAKGEWDRWERNSNSTEVWDLEGTQNKEELPLVLLGFLWEPCANTVQQVFITVLIWL